MIPSFGSPNVLAMRRIQSELKDWCKNPPEGCSLESETPDPIFTWVILMQGPEPCKGMPRLYEGEVYRLQVKFTDSYPLDSPEVTFLRESPVHPHIYSNGHICLDVLYDNKDGGWSPALTINKICLSLRSMLASNTVKVRPAEDERYCQRTRDRSPKLTQWVFDDTTV